MRNVDHADPGASRVPARVLAVLDAVLLLALLVMAAAWLLDPLRIRSGGVRLTMSWGWKPVLIVVAVAAARIVAGWRAARAGQVSIRGLWARRGYRAVAAPLLSLIVFFGVFEGVLCLVGFENVVPPIVFQGKTGLGLIRDETIPDAELLYVLEPGSTFQGRRINSMGFREREVSVQKAPGTRRVICLGDSCTAQGAPGYAQYLHDRLNRAPPTAEPWEAFNMGTHGYASLQGLRLFMRWAERVQPDFVTIYFGWNDHWLADVSDREQMATRMDPISGRLYDRLSRKRFFQFLNYLGGRSVHRAKVPAERVLRVAPDDYRANLTELVARVREAGAVPILITAPHGRMSSQEVRKQYVLSIEDGIEKHARYVAITREVAAATGAELLDLAAILDGEANYPLFARDGIHFDAYSRESELTNDLPVAAQPGLNRVADELYAKIVEIAKPLQK